MNKLLPLILILAIGFVSYGVYTQANKSLKSKRLDCQANTTTFERLFLEAPLKEAIDSFKSNNYSVKSNIEYSKIMSSNLINILNVEQANEILERSIAANINTKNTHIEDEHKVLIDYYIYENDKEDKGKKNKDAKNYAGYLVFEFKYNNTLVYKIQTDYMNLNGTDIEDRMNCVIKSFISIN